MTGGREEMNKLSKLFGAKPSKEKPSEEPSPKPEDITLLSRVSPAKSRGRSRGRLWFAISPSHWRNKNFCSLSIAIGRGGKRD
jgi:hypothetical protein